MEAMISAKIPVFKVTSRARWEGGGEGGAIIRGSAFIQENALYKYVLSILVSEITC